MGSPRGVPLLAFVLAAVACGPGIADDPQPTAGPASPADPPHADRPPFQPTFDGGALAPDAAAPADVVDAAFDARLETMIHALVGASYDASDWEARLRARPSFSGVKIWIPGTGEPTADAPGGARAMASVPSGLASGGPAITFAPSAPASIGFWLGIPCSQSIGGALFAQRDRLSALDVFTTAWSDARTIATTFGPALKGAWIIGHSAGAWPALLAGLLAGAHRVDAYGVPSAVGALDGDDGLVHLHTHPFDPAGSMGSLGSDGSAQIDLLSAFVTAIEAGGSLAYHDYSAWPAPSP